MIFLDNLFSNVSESVDLPLDFKRSRVALDGRILLKASGIAERKH